MEFPVVIVGDTSWSQKEQKELLLFDKGEEGICFASIAWTKINAMGPSWAS